MKKKLGFFAFAALLVGAALALGLSACSNGSDGTPLIIVMPGSNNDTDGSNTNSGEPNRTGTSSGGEATPTDNGTSAPTTTTTTTNTTTPTETGGEQTQNTPPVIYTITFNANDGSQNPATVPQNFTFGIPQPLTSIEELGFFKDGFYFAGWGVAPKSKQASYADEASYSATANAILYALWSEIPVCSVSIPVNANGSVTSTPATARAGTEIALSNTPNMGYQFASYTVIDTDGNEISVIDGKFTMPAKNVTVTATFNAINYNINIGTADNGCVSANALIATIGTSVTLTASPALGYELAALTVINSDGTNVFVSGTGNVRTFVMPAKNVTVSATFNAINYNINVGTADNGSVTPSVVTATVGTSVTITTSPTVGYELSALVVSAADGSSVFVSGIGNSRTFIMPANDVFVSATFNAINYNINVELMKNGSIMVNPATAAVGTSVTLNITPASGYELSMLTVTTSDGTCVNINGNGVTRSFTMPAQHVTVSAMFDAYIMFGYWPQTIKAKDVRVSYSEQDKLGGFICQKGSDGGCYILYDENAPVEGQKYSDGTAVKKSSANSSHWFKVEPIKWRVLTTNYRGTNKKLLLSEKILAYCIYSDVSYGFQYGVGYLHRTINGSIVYPNNYEHSRVRAFLNGLSYMGDKESKNLFLDKGFLQLAFNEEEIASIVDTRVDNSARSTNPDANAQCLNGGENMFASDTTTIDKIFLLSVQEATNYEYGFDDYNNRGAGNTRIRKVTDCAMASGVWQNESVNGEGTGGSWLLRSPACWGSVGDKVCGVSENGFLYCTGGSLVDDNRKVGIVPALCLEN